jgi:hypothetical protein
VTRLSLIALAVSPLYLVLTVSGLLTLMSLPMLALAWATRSEILANQEPNVLQQPAS